MRKNESVEVLAVTMKQVDASLITKMNIQTDAIISNQCDTFEVVNYCEEGKKISYINTATRGVGVNRNIALLNASKDICLLADDDMRFYDNYEKIVLDTFRKYNKADVIIFNIEEKPIVRPVTKKVININLLNYRRYGAARIAFIRKSVSYHGIFFNTNFGGGTEHSSGEDSLFLRDCLNKGLKIKAVPITIAKLQDVGRESTWFCGFTEKFFFDKGVFYALAHKKTAFIWCLQYCLRNKTEVAECGFSKALTQMKKGIKYIKNREW